MRKYFMTYMAVIALPLSAGAIEQDISKLPSGTYEVDKTHASITWKVSHLGLSYYTARFTDFDATIDLNTENLAKSSVNVSINPASVKTDYPHPEKKDFDKKLATGKDWFNAEKFPTATFKSTNVVKITDTTGKITGDLTFLGTSQPVELDVTFNGGMEEHPYAKKPALGFSAHTTLKRSEWGFNTYVPNIGDEVEVLIEAEFVKKDGE